MSELERIAADYARRDAEVPARRYDPTNPAQLFIRHGIDRALVRVLAQAGVLPLAGRRIADIGCGHGQWLADLETLGAECKALAGIDLIPERAAAARARLPAADIREGDASFLPWEDGSFDIVCQSMMFSSMLEEKMRRRAAAEMVRVLAGRGIIVWYDFVVNSPGNPGVRGVRRAEVSSLFPGFELTWRRVTLAPPIVRVLVPRLRFVASLLQALTVMNTHAMGLLSRR